MQTQRRSLDVEKIIEPILKNFDENVKYLIRLLSGINCILLYDGPNDFRRHLIGKSTYACSVKCQSGSKTKILKNVFPIMLGSALDFAIRKNAQTEFQNYPTPPPHYEFETADIAITLFLINGTLKQVPYFFTNDSTNIHVIKDSVVRVYTYDSDEKGKELTLYVNDEKKCGQIIISHNNGATEDYNGFFFPFCQYPTAQEIYMMKHYLNHSFDIDNLANKIVISPGHLFVRLFVKYLFVPMRERNWKVVKAKAIIVVKSIITGKLLHVLSRKTQYGREMNSNPKIISNQLHRELGMNGEIYVEKNIGCYREISLQTYPLIPYWSHLIVRQISSKVKKSHSALGYHPSYLGFLCILGTFDTKNVCRSNMMVRNTYVSVVDELDPIAHKTPGKKLYAALNLDIDPVNKQFFVVVNEACIPVTQNSFERIDLKLLKDNFVHIECYFFDQVTIIIRYKTGLIFKQFPNGIWVTPKDELYWAEKCYAMNNKLELADKFGFDYLTSYHVDMNPFFPHNAFPKNILAFNALKNAVLATDSTYSRYFLETVSAYTQLTTKHEIVCEAKNNFSSHFVLQVPRVNVSYISHNGNNQEDCIVMRENLRVFDCFKFYTLRLRLECEERIFFYPIRGDIDENDTFGGTIVAPLGSPIKIETQSMHVKCVKVKNNLFHVHFNKTPFRILQYDMSQDTLAICVDSFRKSETGNKLCSFHGQKGVIRTSDKMFSFDGHEKVDLLLNPYGMFRMTMGQILEGLYHGNGKDVINIRNDEGQLIPNGRAFYAKTFYFPISYWSAEHFYAPSTYAKDKISSQPLKGRSRSGGMRLGTMEYHNCFRGNGLSSCCEEKMIDDSDRTRMDNIIIPKSAILCQEDAKFHKVLIEFNTESLIEELDS